MYITLNPSTGFTDLSIEDRNASAVASYWLSGRAWEKLCRVSSYRRKKLRSSGPQEIHTRLAEAYDARCFSMLCLVDDMLTDPMHKACCGIHDDQQVGRWGCLISRAIREVDGSVKSKEVRTNKTGDG